MRFSRPCYNKHARCPGSAGGGTRSAKVDRCPAGGSLARVINYESRWWRWRCHRCPKCGVIVLPVMVRWLDWRFWGWKVDDLKRWWADR